MGLGKSFTRRGFLKASLAAAVAPYAITRFSLAENPPSERITVGLIGTGNRGTSLLGGLGALDEAQVLAVCDIDGARLAKALATARNRSGQNACQAYRRWREVVAREDIDAVIVATPDHWHALMTIAAARAGKDIYCEKPLCTTIEEGQAMVAAVRRHGRICQTGSQQRSDRNFRFACQLVRNGRIGKLKTITAGLTASHAPHPQDRPSDDFDFDTWLGPAPRVPFHPQRTHWNFRWILDYSGGQLTDWGAHQVDIAQWGHGTSDTGPVEIELNGPVRFTDNPLYDAPEQFTFTSTFADGVKLVTSSRADRGIRFEGSEGTLFVKRGWLVANPRHLLDTRFGPDAVQLPVSHNHLADFLQAVKTRRDPIAPVEHGHRSISICHLGAIAMRLGRKIRWDPQAQTIGGDPAAARMLGRAYRQPYQL